ncbi:hydroxymethylglutaryl-CoA reductase, degradative [Agrilactobacillus fermenti]|uniref:hydroxymethylglutaryl-CoA reductase, degradative n=1 Tax=Agrilactobacillus fermenti TaxID=2586909 RepID=UPI003A5C6999
MTKFYELSREARLKQLLNAEVLDEMQYKILLANQQIPAEIANNMVENQLTQYAIPEGLVRNMLINNQVYQIPLVTEEPSVIAAANYAAKLSTNNGGFHVEAHRDGLLGQVVFADINDLEQKAQMIKDHAVEIKDAADAAYPSIVNRGGGLKKQTVTIVAERFLKLTLLVDTKAAMGANMVNEISEKVGQLLTPMIGQPPLMAILSNHAPQDVTTATVRLAVDTLTTPTLAGLEVAKRIVQASAFAHADFERAVTHNKGIMNGITAVVTAYGNDTRAIASAAHAFAARSGSYHPLSSWILEGQFLVGQLQVPLPIGAVGGSIGIVPMARTNQEFARAKDPVIMQQQIAAVGLASNLAALRALVTDGIQKGHMNLQFKALAMQAGAKGTEIPWLQHKLKVEKHANLEIAQRLLAEKRKGNL